MNADHYFEIGSSHRVCQDYALSGVKENLAYAIVSDGCSGAIHSEIGAQILCHAAKYYIELFHASSLFQNTGLEALLKILGRSILQKADEIRKCYVIDPAALQATLLIAIFSGGRRLIFGWGDGVIIEDYGQGKIITEIDFESNAPYYLATNPDSYAAKFSKTRVKHRIWMKDSLTEEEWSYNAFYAKEEINEPRSITLCSDGIKSYQDEKRTPIEVLSMVPQFIDYPDYKGPFVQRNMNFLKRSMEKQKWSHHDDISTACIAL